jgi:hypothetical protein
VVLYEYILGMTCDCNGKGKQKKLFGIKNNAACFFEIKRCLHFNLK